MPGGRLHSEWVFSSSLYFLIIIADISKVKQASRQYAGTVY